MKSCLDSLKSDSENECLQKTWEKKGKEGFVKGEVTNREDLREKGSGGGPQVGILSLVSSLQTNIQLGLKSPVAMAI